MTSNSDELAKEVLAHSENYVRAFNSGDPAAVDSLYTEDAVSVWEPGKPVSGAERRAGLAEYLARKPVMAIQVLESYVTSDTALLAVDWTIDIPSPVGPERQRGIGVDVLRRGTDGQWRFAIDNPYGTDA
ncbi:nuclear transport factor 2 family protein [Streptomyces sp. ISL-112]|uniref:YybH family protein n=1 Tax=unclassified Streptomyces TaxID=2593676 RepID=UPI001BEBC2CA|nr:MULTISPECIES: nuclear transport factor 2 family protein [unclassified Streptomyces]MBT2426315.1 nuclear transport factor 2 family protein [Streptomyces sp. ISL-112]MBT2465831.1 nuclear transport factor 2 family protein [Streptomyces sp. ISL-63]